MTRTDSTKRPDVEVMTATVVDGMLVTGDVADAPVTAAAFAPVDDPGLVEQRVVDIARGIAGGEQE
jgi:hypothetical protein